MGVDKATLVVGGRPLALRVAGALEAAGAGEVFAVGGDAEILSDLGLEVVPDRYPGQGPLGGLITAIASASNDAVVVTACDLPSVNAETIVEVLEALGSFDAAVPVLSSARQFLCGAYHKRCLGPLLAAFEAGERSIHRSLGHLEVVEVSGLDPASLRDADTPGDLERG
ncbi:MAG: Molybdenum cofactor guanylyltransferase [Acidimicrobiales bacterium]|nr:MAG: molybdenum cofactor guanylyltransferase [Actinomycetota bacterium]MBV6507304.1 Molybdenum cofactor guanylyltransferase [Acidimicrobiales bacterium]RIK04087.1 MAG: hypothetical protein DCC48_14305 [Acidobacteriota bacterium]